MFIAILLVIYGIYQVLIGHKTLGFTNIFVNLSTLFLLYKNYKDDNDNNLTMTT